MAKIFVHTRSDKNPEWLNEPREMTRIPTVGEIITLIATGTWFRVELVIHTPHEHGGYDGEVFAIGVDHMEEMRNLSEPRVPNVSEDDSRPYIGSGLSPEQVAAMIHGDPST